MTVRILPAPHSRDCVLCGGEGRVRWSRVRLRRGAVRADWVSHVITCPLRSGADDLRLMLPREDTPGGAA
jgi:hypothetical protein